MSAISELRAKFTATAQGFRQTVQSIQDDFNNVGDAGADGADKANDGFANLKNTLMGFAGAYLGFEAITGAVGGIIGITDQYQQALNKLETQSGATKDEMAGMEESLKNIYANNYGESFDDIATSMALVQNNTGLTGKELENATTKAILLRDTFEFDIAESTKVADTMMKQFGITSDQAFTLMAQGQQDGLNKSDDMMDSFNEYSVYFKQLGYDAEGMWAVFKAGADGGAFNMDKVGDAVKEFGIRAKDGSKATSEAFQGLGFDAQKMQMEIAKGGPSAQKAMEQTFNALGKIEDPMKRNTIGVALFGTQFEDLEHKTVMALGNVQAQADMSGDTLANIDAVKYDNIGSAFEGLKRQIIVGLLEPIQTQVMPMLNKFVTWAQANMPAIKDAIVGAFTNVMTVVQKLAPIFENIMTILKNVGSVVIPILVGAIGGILAVGIPVLTWVTDMVAKFTEWEGFVPVVAGLATAIGVYTGIVKAGQIATFLMTNAVKAWTIAQKALNFVMKMNPIGLVISIIAGLIVMFVLAYQKSETFRNIVNGAFESIKNVVSGIINWFVTTIPAWIENIKTWFSGLGSSLSKIWQGIKDGAVAIWDGLVKAVMFIVNGWINLVKAYFNAWKNAIMFIFNALKTGVILVWERLKTGAINIVTGLINAVVTSFNWVRDKALYIWNALKTGVQNAITNLKNTVVSIATNIKDRIITAFQTAKDKAVYVFNAMRDGVANVIGKVKSKIIEMKDNIISTIKGISLFQMGKDMIQGLINGIKNMAGKLVSSAKGVVDGAISGAKKLLGINSPSRVFMQFGEWTGEGLAIGIDRMKGMVADATGTLTDASFGAINDAELNPITATVEGGGQVGQPVQTGSNYNAPLMNIENYYQNDNTDVRSLSHNLYNLQRNSERKKGR